MGIVGTVRDQPTYRVGGRRVETARDETREGWQAPVELVSELFSDADESRLRGLTDAILARQQPDGGWSESPHAGQSDLDTSVLNHLALVKTLRRQVLAGDAPLVARMGSSLEKSWMHLAGRVPIKNERELRALPWHRVVRHVSQGPALMHETLLGHSLAVRMDRRKSLDEAIEACRQEPKQAQSHLGLVLKALGAVAVTGGLAAAAVACPGAALAVSLVAADFAAGLVAGWAVSSGNESYFHDNILHASTATRARIARWTEQAKTTPTVAKRAKALAGKAVLYGFYGHTKTHHAETDNDNFLNKLEDPQRRDRRLQRLAKDGRLDMVRKRFGQTTNWGGYLAYQLVAVPSYLVAGVAGLLLGARPAFAVGFAIPSLAYPLFSKTSYHERVHTEANEALEGNEVLDKASLPMRAYLKSWPSRLMVGHHYRHHVSKPRETRDCNYNLIPFPIADKLRGKFVAVSTRQEEEMADKGLLYW